jgi:hypothetical protein
MWKGVVLASAKVLPWHPPGETEKNHKNFYQERVAASYKHFNEPPGFR